MRSVLITLFVFFIATGCSTKILLPYEDEPRCKPNNGYGDCGSVSNIYKEIHNPNPRSKK